MQFWIIQDSYLLSKILRFNVETNKNQKVFNNNSFYAAHCRSCSFQWGMVNIKWIQRDVVVQWTVRWIEVKMIWKCKYSTYTKFKYLTNVPHWTSVTPTEACLFIVNRDEGREIKMTTQKLSSVICMYECLTFHYEKQPLSFKINSRSRIGVNCII
jgi:hypothetical protein